MTTECETIHDMVVCLRRGLVIALILFLIFLGFTFAVKHVDRAAVGFGGETIGLSHLNASVQKTFPFEQSCYKITQFLGYFCLMLAGANAVISLLDLIRAKKLRNMTKRYLVTMFFYAVVVMFYALFEVIVINNRPIAAEASYPSSHTVLALCVFYSEFVLLRYCAKRNAFWAMILRIACIVAMVAMAVLRLLSGVHWFTDIIGAVLLSSALIVAYKSIVDYADPYTL